MEANAYLPGRLRPRFNNTQFDIHRRTLAHTLVLRELANALTAVLCLHGIGARDGPLYDRTASNDSCSHTCVFAL